MSRLDLKFGIALGALALALVAGCGDDDEAPATSTPRATDTPAGSQPDLGRYLLQDGELAGLRAVAEPQTDTGDPFELPPEGDALLERSGYLSATFQPVQSERAGGVSNVLLFESEEGALAWLAYETSDGAIRHQIPDVVIKRFAVPGLPGARGWTGLDLHGNPIGHVYWTQGRCMLLVGYETDGPRVPALVAAAKAIHERTGGTCPD